MEMVSSIISSVLEINLVFFIFLSFATIILYTKDTLQSILLKKKLFRFQKIIIVWLISFLLIIFSSLAALLFQMSLPNSSCGGDFFYKECPKGYWCSSATFSTGKCVPTFLPIIYPFH